MGIVHDIKASVAHAAQAPVPEGYFDGMRGGDVAADIGSVVTFATDLTEAVAPALGLNQYE